MMFELNSVYNFQVQVAILNKIAQSLSLVNKTDLLESIAIGAVFSIQPFTKKVELTDFSKDFMTFTKCWHPGIKN